MFGVSSARAVAALAPHFLVLAALLKLFCFGHSEHPCSSEACYTFSMSLVLSSVLSSSTSFSFMVCFVHMLRYGIM